MQEEREKNSKKALILSVLGVLLLVIAVVGVSYAMFTFSGTGVRENVITTGVVNIEFDNSEGGDVDVDGDGEVDASGTIALTNQYPMTDAKGQAQTGKGNVLGFKVSAEITGTMTIHYDLALDSVVEGSTLTKEHVKVALYQGKGEEAGYGTDLVGGYPKTVKELESQQDTEEGQYIQSYYLGSGTFTKTDSQGYMLKVWVADTYDLPHSEEGSSDGTHTSTTTSEIFKFKVKIVAHQK